MAEAIAEVDEELMDIYFNEGGFTDEQFGKGLTKGILQGDIVPVFKCSSLTGEGVKEVLQEIIEFVPNPTIEGYRAKDENQQPVLIEADPNAKPVLFIFKTLADSFLGKISLAKVVSGKVSAGMTLHNFRVEKDEKLGSVFFVRGKEKIDCKAAGRRRYCRARQAGIHQDRRYLIRKEQPGIHQSGRLPAANPVHGDRIRG